MIIMRHGVESIHYHVHNTKFASLQGPVNPFTAPACKISGLCEKCTYTPANSIFSGTITNLLSVPYCALWGKSIHMLMWKRKQKGLRIPHLYWPFSSDITAVERLKGISPSHSDDHNLHLTTFFFFFNYNIVNRDLVINIRLTFQFWYSILIYSPWFFPSKNTCTPWR